MNNPSKAIFYRLGECLRVLKDDGYLFLEIPSIMAIERRVPHTTIFPEYVLKLFYDLCGQDRSVRIEQVNRMLSTYFEHVRNTEVRGKVIIHAANKKIKSIHESGPSRVGSLGSRAIALTK